MNVFVSTGDFLMLHPLSGTIIQTPAAKAKMTLAKK